MTFFRSMMISSIANTDNDFFDETENQLCSNLTILHLICAFDQTYLLKHFLLYYGLAAVSRITTISKQTFENEDKGSKSSDKVFIKSKMAEN